jgi:hypothetical protein
VLAFDLRPKPHHITQKDRLKASSNGKDPARMRATIKDERAARRFSAAGSVVSMV